MVRLKIDGFKLAKSFVRRTAARRLSNVVNHIGPGGFTWLVEHNEPLKSLLCFIEYSGPDIPDMDKFLNLNIDKLRNLSRSKEVEFRAQAPHYKWASDSLSDQEITDLLPDFARDVILTEKGSAWWIMQLQWARGLFSGNG